MFDRFEGPDFIGVGVQRAGTSWLYQCLLEHPQVFMPRKEIHFFDQHYELGIDWYSRQFSEAGVDQVRGEYTPDYLASPETIEKIYRFRPDVKILLILREPLARAYSAVKLFQSHGRFEGQSSSEVLQSEPWILRQSLYYHQIKHLFSLFDQDKVQIELYDDIVSDPAGVFSRVCQFLLINDQFLPSGLYAIRNSSAHSGLQGRHRLPELQTFIMKSWFGKYLQPIKKTPIFHALKRYIINLERRKDIYSDIDSNIRTIITTDIYDLQDMVNIDFSKWLAKYE